MPVTTGDVTAVSQRTLATIFIPVEGSILSSLTLVDMTNAQQPNDAYGEIGIMSGGTNPQNKVAALGSGYMGRDISVSWSGKIITEAGMWLYAHIYSSTGGPFRLNGLVTPYKVGEKGELILDP